MSLMDILLFAFIMFMYIFLIISVYMLFSLLMEDIPCFKINDESKWSDFFHVLRSLALGTVVFFLVYGLTLLLFR